MGAFNRPVSETVETRSVRDKTISTHRTSFLFLALPIPRLPHRASAAGLTGIVSLFWHLLVVTAVVLAGRSGPFTTSLPAVASSRRPAVDRPLQIPRIVFLQAPRLSGGGGGGGGNRQPAPPSRAQGIGRDRLTLPVARPIVVSEQPTEPASPLQQVALDALPLISGTAFQIGLPGPPASRGFSLGPGYGGGVGDGVGTGIGSGTGSGIGSGSGGGFGGGAYRLGGGVVPPTVVKEVKPRYTSEALMRNIEGRVVLEVVVGREGIPTAIRLMSSLDPGGLDSEAVKAVQEWRFNPGRFGETPVDVLVTIILDFRID
jgi:periplasmic protein TonB